MSQLEDGKTLCLRVAHSSADDHGNEAEALMTLRIGTVSVLFLLRRSSRDPREPLG